MSEQIEHFFADLFQFEAQIHQHLRRHALLFAQQAEQNMFRADVVMVQVAGFFHRILDDLFGPRRLRQFAHGDHVGSALDELLDL